MIKVRLLKNGYNWKISSSPEIISENFFWHLYSMSKLNWNYCNSDCLKNIGHPSECNFFLHSFTTNGRQVAGSDTCSPFLVGLVVAVLSQSDCYLDGIKMLALSYSTYRDDRAQIGNLGVIFQCFWPYRGKITACHTLNVVRQRSWILHVLGFLICISRIFVVDFLSAFLYLAATQRGSLFSGSVYLNLRFLLSEGFPFFLPGQNFCEILLSMVYSKLLWSKLAKTNT